MSTILACNRSLPLDGYKDEWTWLLLELWIENNRKEQSRLSLLFSIIVVLVSIPVIVIIILVVFVLAAGFSLQILLFSLVVLVLIAIVILSAILVPILIVLIWHAADGLVEDINRVEEF